LLYRVRAARWSHENTLTLARNAYDDGQVRFQVALANLKTLTGSF
jgi:hypothetical protein